MLARTLAARVRDDLLLASSLACLLLHGYASRATASDANDITIDEDQPRAASASSSATAVAATVPTILQPRVLIYDGVCHLCHRGET
jgi:cytochrome c5